MISFFERVRVPSYGHHHPTVRIGPLLPLSWSQAGEWLGAYCPRKRLGFKHSLVRGVEGQIMVVEAGVKLPTVAFVPPREWSNGKH